MIDFTGWDTLDMPEKILVASILVLSGALLFASVIGIAVTTLKEIL